MAEFDDAEFLAVSNTFTLPKGLMASDLSIQAKATFAAIAYQCDNGKAADMSDLVDTLSKSRSSVVRYLNELKEAGWIDFVQQDGSGKKMYAVSRELPIYQSPDAARDTKWSSQDRVEAGGQDITQFVMDVIKASGLEPTHNRAMQIVMRLANSELDEDQYRKYLTDDISKLAARVHNGDLREQQALGYVATRSNVEWWLGADSKDREDAADTIDWSELEEREG